MGRLGAACTLAVLARPRSGARFLCTARVLGSPPRGWWKLSPMQARACLRRAQAPPGAPLFMFARCETVAQERPETDMQALADRACGARRRCCSSTRTTSRQSWAGCAPRAAAAARTMRLSSSSCRRACRQRPPTWHAPKAMAEHGAWHLLTFFFSLQYVASLGPEGKCCPWHMSKPGGLSSTADHTC